MPEIWLGECRVWKGARPNGYPKVADDMRMVKVRTDPFRIRSRRNGKSEKGGLTDICCEVFPPIKAISHA